jgi:hypothetical protein
MKKVAAGGGGGGPAPCPLGREAMDTDRGFGVASPLRLEGRTIRGYPGSSPIPRRETLVAVSAARGAGSACSAASPVHGHHDDHDDHDDDNDRSCNNSNQSTWHENNLRVNSGRGKPCLVIQPRVTLAFS